MNSETLLPCLQIGSVRVVGREGGGGQSVEYIYTVITKLKDTFCGGNIYSIYGNSNRGVSVSFNFGGFVRAL